MTNDTQTLTEVMNSLRNELAEDYSYFSWFDKSVLVAGIILVLIGFVSILLPAHSPVVIFMDWMLLGEPFPYYKWYSAYACWVGGCLIASKPFDKARQRFYPDDPEQSQLWWFGDSR